MLELLFQLWDAAEPVVVPAAVAVLSAKSLTIFTPTTSSVKVINVFLKILNNVALNVLKDKNKDA